MIQTFPSNLVARRNTGMTIAKVVAKELPPHAESTAEYRVCVSIQTWYLNPSGSVRVAHVYLQDLVGMTNTP